MEYCASLDQNSGTKICILSSVHQAFDVRILHKEAKTLVQAGYEVILVAQHRKDEIIDGVEVIALSTSRSRFSRLIRTGYEILKLALKQKADIYHFHDPELIPVGLLLKIRGKKVIYDVHEDVPRQILSKYWIPLRLRSLSSKAANLAEKVGARALDGIIAATPTIAARFPTHKTVSVQNFPILGELATPRPLQYGKRPLDVVYIGGITDIRGAREMVQAIGLLPKDLDVRLVLAGNFSPITLEQELKTMPGWFRVKFLGWQSRSQIADLLARVRVGLIVLRPLINYLDSYPIKLFEYMSAGIPVIASNFTLWREIIDGAKCGLLVDPFDVKAIAEAIIWLLENPHEAEVMGKRGQEAVYQKFNWTTEADKLIAYYNELIS